MYETSFALVLAALIVVLLYIVLAGMYMTWRGAIYIVRYVWCRRHRVRW